jgi:hypothetical protein
VPKTERTLEAMFFHDVSTTNNNGVGHTYYASIVHEEPTFLPSEAGHEVRRDFLALTEEEITTRLVLLKMGSPNHANGWREPIRSLHASRLKRLQYNKKRREKRAANVPRTDPTDS